MEKDKFKGFMSMMRKKIRRKKEQKAEKEGNPAWAKKLSGSDKMRYEAVKRANKRREEKMKK